MESETRKRRGKKSKEPIQGETEKRKWSIPIQKKEYYKSINSSNKFC